MKSPKSWMIVFACLSASPVLASPTISVVKDINGSTTSSPNYLTASGSNLFFTAFTSANGTELWKSDGTLSGTNLVTNLSSDPLPTVNSTAFTQFAPLSSGVVFAATTTDGNGEELYKSTISSAALLKDINAGSGSSSPFQLTTLGSKVYFSADNGTDGPEPWVTDGTAGGTYQIKNIETTSGIGSSPGEFVQLGSNVLFSASTISAGASQLYKTNGTANNASVVGASVVAEPSGLVTSGTKVFFSGKDVTVNDLGQELYVTDGTTVTQVADINSGSGSSNPSQLKATSTGILFVADDGTNGQQLWKASPTSATILSNFSGFADINDLVVNGNIAYFTADDGVAGKEIWKYNGLTDTVSLLKDIAAGTATANPSELTFVGDKLFFSTEVETSPSHFTEQLWWSDGTALGTQPVFTAPGLNAGNDPLGLLTPIGNSLFFVAATSTTTGGDSTNSELYVAVVPEPASMTLLAGGLLLTLCRRKRQRF